MLADLPLPELRAYQPDVDEPADFDDLWARQLAGGRGLATEPSFMPVDSPIRHAAVYDVTFAGHGGDPIKGWLLAPHEAPTGAALVVEYVGYGGGRGDPVDWLKWSCAGHPHLIIDCRGPGRGWRPAHTARPGGTRAPRPSRFLNPGTLQP